MIHIDIELPHMRLAALTNKTVDSAQPTLVFLHGYLDNANSFASIIPFLEQYQCIAIDMAGHGHSQHRSVDAHYHLVDYAYDLHQLIAILKLQNVILIGHSLGAIVCSLYAATQPKVLAGFISIESCGPLSEHEDTTAQQIRNCIESRIKANAPIKQPLSFERMVAARCAISDLSQQQASLLLSRNIEVDEQGQCRWLTDKRLRTKSPIRMTELQANNVLENIICKRALILGKQGFEKVRSAVQLRHKAFSKVEIFEFEGGHHVHLQSPNLVANCILRQSLAFLAIDSRAQ